ncbi:hypothetical protein [Cellulomonas denverensis]
MYLSHYVDVPRGLLPGLADASNDYQYLSAWITDDDRLVYDRFLSTSSTLEHADALKQAANALIDLKGAVTHPVFEAVNLITVTSAALDGATGVEDVKGTINSWSRYLGSTSDSPERVVENLVDGSLSVESLNKQVVQDTVGLFAAGVGAAAVGSGPIGWLATGAVQLANMAYFGTRTLAQQANYAAMIASNQGRYSERLWRYLMGG